MQSQISKLIDDTSQDFKLFKEFKSNKKIKKKMLKELLEALPEPWKIIGITPQAFNLLKSNSYKLKDQSSKKNLPIQRAHIFDRDVWYSELLEKEWSCSGDWYNFIKEKDITVLALSSENSKIRSIRYIEFPENINLFKSNRISWSHTKKEENFLKSLEDIIDTNSENSSSKKHSL